MWVAHVVILLLTAVPVHLQHHTKGTSLGHDWGPWTGWSVCTHTCGHGTAYRIRQCHAHHRHGNGATCDGPSKQYRICLVQNCSADDRGYRWRECAKHNTIYYGHQTYSWTPYIHTTAPCELACKTDGHKYYARFNQTVIDGVTCNDDNTAICMQGKCLAAGCDGILESSARPDVCGVCNGDGSTCRLTHGIFTRTNLPGRGYHHVTTIPAGARSINITELARSRNHIALATSSGYFLNGEMKLQREGTVQGAGTSFLYGRGSGTWCLGECLTADGPLNTSLKVELLSFGRNPGISYQYTTGTVDVLKANHVHIASQNHRQDSFNTGDRTVQKEVIPRTSDETSYQSDTSPARSGPRAGRAQASRPLASTVLYGPNRDQLFVEGENGSIEYKHYYHTNLHDNLGDVPMLPAQDSRQQTVPDSRQTAIQDSRQPKLIQRRIEPLHISNVRRENTHRLAEFRANPQHLSAAEGASIPNVIPATYETLLGSKSGRGHPAPPLGYTEHDNKLSDGRGLYSWRILGFTPCSEPCGGGLQVTRIVCVKEDTQVEVIEENCEPALKLASTHIVCNNQPCQASWHLGDWSSCSVTCDRGLQKRVVECQQKISPTLTLPVSADNCPHPKPASRQFCQQQPCFSWNVTEWSKCSAACGFGQRKRGVVCVDPQNKSVSESLCTSLKPLEEDICDMGSCAHGWFHTRWSTQCSATCGRGLYTRQVYCSAPDGSKLDESKCGGKKHKPREHKSCKAKNPCGGQWFTGPWSQCNGTCGTGASRHRDVLCIKHHGKYVNQIVKEHNCVLEEKPAAREVCRSLPECSPQWFMTEWSQCSKTCGLGVKTREVKCLDADLNPSTECQEKGKPSRRDSCNPQQCEERYMEFSETPMALTNEAVQMDGSVVGTGVTCKDSESSRWCHLAKQARLCHYLHYKKICCHTCTKFHLKPH
ncbi:thrombospondin type-1 domain-containing protein 4-like isoform X2 [Physella acuta]|uniref:thrombospondin type-1 domain-containing protein 4-like isoform X2 n=1 Tax=Physella acuta TaxID=109671 RepID=UPI0027DB47C6|nr:thrombospondin type-1 domain-containing protein 4-like isoform X2 [Physella acuta]